MCHSHVTGSELLDDYVQHSIPGAYRDAWFRWACLQRTKVLPIADKIMRNTNLAITCQHNDTLGWLPWIQAQ